MRGASPHHPLHPAVVEFVLWEMEGKVSFFDASETIILCGVNLNIDAFAEDEYCFALQRRLFSFSPQAIKPVNHRRFDATCHAKRKKKIPPKEYRNWD